VRELQTIASVALLTNVCVANCMNAMYVFFFCIWHCLLNGSFQPCAVYQLLNQVNLFGLFAVGFLSFAVGLLSFAVGSLLFACRLAIIRCRFAIIRCRFATGFYYSHSDFLLFVASTQWVRVGFIYYTVVVKLHSPVVLVLNLRPNGYVLGSHSSIATVLNA